MKILFLQKTTKFSGAESIVITLMKLLQKKGVEVLYVSPDGVIRSFVEKQGLTFYAADTNNPLVLKQVFKIFNPDIIHATDYHMSVSAAFLSGKIPVISHLHNNPLWLRKPLSFNAISYALALPFIKKVVSVSSSIEREFCYSNLIKNKNTVISNIVDVNRVLEKSMAPMDINNYDIVFMGRLTDQKDPIFFCSLIKELKNKHPHITALMIGEGELYSQVLNYIDKNDLQDNITLTGFVSNPYPIIKKAKVGVMPSKYEGFGLAAVEMMALGKPVICSGVGGLRDIVNSSCGKICRTFEEYLKEIDTMISNESIYRSKSVEARKRAKKFSNLIDYRDKFLKLYKECVDHGK